MSVHYIESSKDAREAFVRIEQKLEANARALRANAHAIEEVRRSLLGDELRPESGLIVRIAELEAQTQENTEARKRFRWMVAGASCVAAAFSTLVGWFLK